MNVLIVLDDGNGSGGEGGATGNRTPDSICQECDHHYQINLMLLFFPSQI